MTKARGIAAGTEAGAGPVQADGGPRPAGSSALPPPGAGAPPPWPETKRAWRRLGRSARASERVAWHCSFLLVSGQLLAVFLYLGFFPPCIFIKQTRQSPEWSHHLFPDSPDEPIMRTAYRKNVLRVVGNHNAVCFLHVQMR